MTPDFNADRPMSLGVVGWNRRDWQDYFPTDMPPEWRLAYLANDCDCVLLRPCEWSGADGAVPDVLGDAVAEAPDHLIFLLETRPGTAPSAARLAPFDGHPVLLLGPRPPGLPEGWSSCPEVGPGGWTAAEGARIEVWSIDAFDLRALRDRALELPPATRFLLLDGPAAIPARIPELRTLVQLLGIA